jgi:predicted transcriptional regulator
MNTKKSRVVTAHVPEDLIQRVEKFAQRQDRSKGWVVRQALEAWVNEEEEIERRLQEGLVDLDAGRTVPHDRVADWLRSQGTGNILPRPRPDDES